MNKDEIIIQITKEVQEMITKLLLKIQNGEDGTDEEMAKWFIK